MSIRREDIKDMCTHAGPRILYAAAAAPIERPLDSVSGGPCWADLESDLSLISAAEINDR
jgi:hypothetical protein